MHRTGLIRIAVFLLLCLPLPPCSAGTRAWTATDPGDPGPCAVSSQVVQISSDLRTYIYYPANGAQLAPPYPGIALAHGFSMFGLINMALAHAGDAEHLASWGYVVAVPVLPDDMEERVSDIQRVLEYLETQTRIPGSFLYQRVDADRLAVAGHSIGGASALALAARDARVKAVVSMDPVYHQGGPFSGDEPALWDPETEGPRVRAPTCILGAPASACNSDADYLEIYPFVGATHKVSLFVSGASHCDFMQPGYQACALFCGGSTDPVRTRLAQKYTTAWFNYYLHFNAQSYAYLYGAEAQADIAAGRVSAQWDTAPKGLVGQGLARSASLQWELYEHPMITGYNIYRRLPEQSYAAMPHAQLGRVSSYLEDGLAAGQVYYYTVRSRDSAGNVHQAANEVRVTVQGGSTPTTSPEATVTPTATSTASPTPTYTPTATRTASQTPSQTPSATPTCTATPSTTPIATPTPTRRPGPCRIFLPAVFVGVGGVQAMLLRQRRCPR